jgi:hypothetical protein
MTQTAAPGLVAGEGTSPTGRSRAGRTCALAAAVLVSGSVLTQAFQATTDVPKDAFSYPWPPSVSLVASLLWGTAQLGLVGGAFAFSRSGVAGSGRLARTGAAAVTIGTSAIALGHALSIPARGETWDDRGAQLAGAAFAIGTILTLAGFLVTAVTTRRAGRWTGYRAWLPAVGAATTLALLAFQLTPLLPLAVGAYALSFLALGLALDDPRDRERPSGTRRS